VILNALGDTLATEIGVGVVLGATGTRFNLLEGAFGTGPLFQMDPAARTLVAGAWEYVKSRTSDAASVAAASVATRRIESKAAKGVRYAARELASAQKVELAATAARGLGHTLAVFNLAKDAAGCW
jgi:hypothetical protein